MCGYSEPKRTFGEKLVSIDFNPESNETVHEIKQAYANEIDRLAGKDTEDLSQLDELTRHAVLAALDAQMLAVKVCTSRQTEDEDEE